MKKDVSIVLPSIRPQNLIKFYQSAELAAKNSTFEIIIPSPYKIPDELMRKGNVKFLHTYSNPTLAFQQAALLCNAEYIYNTTDDGLLQENVIDIAVKIMSKAGEKDVVNMIYNEGVLDHHTLEPLQNHASFHPEAYWFAWAHGELRQQGIESHWQIAPHFFMKLSYFYELGGFDCHYEYSNHALHDLIFRLQADGGQVINSPIVALKCAHLPGKSGDHGPIVDAQTGPDIQRFLSIYMHQNAAKQRIKIEYNDWKNHPTIWERRFDKNNLSLTP